MVPTPSERQRIQFAYNAYLDSLVGVTFNYLIKNPHFPSRVGKHKGIDAMTAFWKKSSAASLTRVRSSNIEPDSSTTQMMSALGV